MKYKLGELATEREIIPPPDGWKEHTVYLVQVSRARNNPIHHALLHVGYVDEKKKLGAFSAVWQNSYSKGYYYHEMFYIEFVKELIPLLH